MAAFDFFAAAERLGRRGEPFATATVVRVERPTSGKPGDRAIVTLDGRLEGWVGGSCTRPTVIEEARAALHDGSSRLIRLARESDDRTTHEGITDLSMTCFSGGTMEIFIEPHLPRLRLLIVGNQEAARSLAAMGRAMGYQIVSVSTGEGPELEGADTTLTSVDSIADHVHPLTAVVVASHGDHDEVALERALAAGAPYVGLIASRKRATSIVEHLQRAGVEAERVEALHAPAGLDIQARQPEEIALSILAEIVQLRRGRNAFAWDRTTETAGTSEKAAATAQDPVCGMTVDPSGAQHLEYHGTDYYFCCGGCLTRFSQAPDDFVAGV